MGSGTSSGGGTGPDPECVADVECPFGFLCENDACVPECPTEGCEPECTSHLECDNRKYCENFACDLIDEPDECPFQFDYRDEVTFDAAGVIALEFVQWEPPSPEWGLIALHERGLTIYRPTQNPIEELPADLGAPAAMTSTDLDADGDTDLVVAFNDPAGGSIVVGENLERARFTYSSRFGAPPGEIEGLDAGDFDANGFVDVVAFAGGVPTVIYAQGADSYQAVAVDLGDYDSISVIDRDAAADGFFYARGPELWRALGPDFDRERVPEFAGSEQRIVTTGLHGSDSDTYYLAAAPKAGRSFIGFWSGDQMEQQRYWVVDGVPRGVMTASEGRDAAFTQEDAVVLMRSSYDWPHVMNCITTFSAAHATDVFTMHESGFAYADGETITWRRDVND